MVDINCFFLCYFLLAPTEHKRTGIIANQEHKVTSAIKRNIETIMSARLVHEGNKLNNQIEMRYLK